MLNFPLIEAFNRGDSFGFCNRRLASAPSSSKL